MAYTVLARRYRSGTFDEVIGQDHVAQTLKKAIASGRIAHAYLFCGTRGVGKTSMARILAKALNCHAFAGPTTEPCGQCESCKAIARGDDIDVIEIDAASNTGVDNVRDVIENSQYRPARSRFKIYIIDEAHMLSKAAFNALLKTLEEPPSHVKFILATTEAEKLLPTILSRCQRYDFRNIPTREIAAHLGDICRRENIAANDDALLLVAKAGAGSMRDSLSLLDRLLSIGEKNLTAEMIEQLLGLPRSQLLFDLAEAIGGGDVKSVLSQSSAIVQGGLSVDSLIVSLVDHLRNLLILRTCGVDSELVEAPGIALNDLAAQAARFDAGALAQDITILEELRRTLRQSQAGRALLDATLVRLTLADQFSSIGEVLGRIAGGQESAPSPRPAPPQRATPPAPPAQKKNDLTGEAPAKPQSTPAQSAPAQSAPAEPPPAQPPPVQAPVAATAAPNDDDDDALPAVGRVWEGPTESLATVMARHRSAAAGSAAQPPASSVQTGNVQPVDVANLPAVWQAMLDLLAASGPMLHSLVSQGQLIGFDDGRVVIRFAPQHETFVRQWEKNGKKDQIREAASKALNQNVGVKFEIANVATAVDSAPTPAATVPRRSAPPAPRPADPAPPEAPTVKVTNELVETLAAESPLIKSVMYQLGGQVIKVE